MLQHAWLSQHVRTWKTCHAWRSGSMCKAELHPNLSCKFTNLPHAFIYLVGLLGTVLGKGIPTTLSSWLPQKIDENLGLALTLEKKITVFNGTKRWQFYWLPMDSRCPRLHVPAVRTFHQRTPRHCQSPTCRTSFSNKKQLINTWQQIFVIMKFNQFEKYLASWEARVPIGFYNMQFLRHRSDSLDSL